MKKQNRNTILFIGFLLLAGIANLMSRSAVPAQDAFMAIVNYLIYIGLLLLWVESVRTRLVLSKARVYMISAALMMFLYILLRVFKYRFATDIPVIRYTVYLYFVPKSLIPALFLMTCLRIHRGNEKGKWNEALLLIPASALSVMALTNDLHRLVYRPLTDLSQFVVNTGTYTYGAGFYLIYAWIIVTAVLGLVMLFLDAGHWPGKGTAVLPVIVFLWIFLVMMNLRVFDIYHMPRMYNVPEIYIFSMLGVFEVCIRIRLIPYNESYPGFFSGLQIPVLITDRQFHFVCGTGKESLPASYTQLCDDEKQQFFRRVLREPVYLTPDRKLTGKEIRAGYAFWEEDEQVIHRAQRKLVEMNEILEQENRLIQAETQQKEKDAYLQARHHIYHVIAEKMYSCQKQIGKLLEKAQPGSADFRDRVARVSVLNAYVKRKTNLLLLAAEKDLLSTQELFLALEESAGYLTLAGLQTTAGKPEEKCYPADRIIGLYDAFELIAEQLIGKTSALMISWNGDRLTLAAETRQTPDTEGICLPVYLSRYEDTLYIGISAGKDGESA